MATTLYIQCTKINVEKNKENWNEVNSAIHLHSIYSLFKCVYAFVIIFFSFALCIRSFRFVVTICVKRWEIRRIFVVVAIIRNEISKIHQIEFISCFNVKSNKNGYASRIRFILFNCVKSHIIFNIISYMKTSVSEKIQSKMRDKEKNRKQWKRDIYILYTEIITLTWAQLCFRFLCTTRWKYSIWSMNIEHEQKRNENRFRKGSSLLSLSNRMIRNSIFIIIFKTYNEMRKKNQY